MWNLFHLLRVVEAIYYFMFSDPQMDVGEPLILPDGEDSIEAPELEGRLTPRSSDSSEEEREEYTKSDEESKPEGDREEDKT